MNVVPGDLDDPRIRALLTLHYETNLSVTPPGSAHVLDIDGLKAPEIDFWAIWRGEEILCVGALKRLGDGHGEVKSMHTAAAGRRTGAASAMVKHLIASARSQGLSRLSLETGSFDFFAPARALYEKHGFTFCPPFAGYTEDPNSAFMTMELI